MRKNERGMALVGLVVTLVVFLGSAFVLTAVAFLDVTVSNEARTRQQIAKLVEVIGGIPEGQASLTQGTGGFLGDVGRLPESLEEINDRTTTGTLCDAANDPAAAPAYHTSDGGTNHRGKVGTGWNGPYYRDMVYTDEHLRDAWGQKFRYACPQTSRTEDGVSLTLRTGTITSAGADGLFDTADDISSEDFYDRGHLFLRITQGGSDKTANPNQVTATMYYASNGEQAMLSSGIIGISTDEGAEEVAVFSSVPAGVRFIQVDFGSQKKEVYHTFLMSNIANYINVKIPVGQGGKG